ncbi:endosomal targeting BRO1-like domain-containing protein [Actinidia rufa]|uniref:Endosomal targeting BRO1-like domain-containing protein n=1 Tax=Actinidia rufa TaxID=165716 RepID=A0A7J0FAF8_9ERIC|nr:endosomal targeting BRO1-like domain-containing protein [Actinidia rufa]
MTNLRLSNGWGEKHRLFVKWKYVEAKAAAYYYHGLILDEGNTEKSHGMAVAAFQAADEYLKESKKASEAFNMVPPLSRILKVEVEFDLSKMRPDRAIGPDGMTIETNLHSVYILKKELCSLLSTADYAAFYRLPNHHFLCSNPPLWGTMKYLYEKIPKDTSSKVRINQDLYSRDKIMETAPTLPDFALALKPDEYQLPPWSVAILLLEQMLPLLLCYFWI